MSEKFEVNIPEDLHKEHYETYDGKMACLMILNVEGSFSVIVNDSYQPIDEPNLIPKELETMLNNWEPEILSPEEAPEYKVNLK
jgi:hypothetical protein